MKDKIIGLFLKKYIAGAVGWLFDRVKGYKTQVGTVLIVAITAGKHFGFIPAEFQALADQVLQVIYGATGISAGDKLRRYWEEAKAVGDEVINK